MEKYDFLAYELYMQKQGPLSLFKDFRSSAKLKKIV